MSYPQKNASYKHEPKFIDRMKEAEARKPERFKQEPNSDDDLAAAEMRDDASKPSGIRATLPIKGD